MTVMRHHRYGDKLYVSFEWLLQAERYPHEHTLRRHEEYYLEAALECEALDAERRWLAA